MSKPILIDAFCAAGGATKGYQRAGFYVIGIDHKPQPNYCGDDFIEADAITFLRDAQRYGQLREYAAIHASPPCQRWLGVPNALGDEYPDLLTPTRELLKQTGLPYVIENVPGAPLDGPVLCGATFGLPIIRHRRFETNPPLLMVPSLCRQSSWERGTEHPGCYPFAHGAWRSAWREHVMPRVWPWMTLEETHDAIPPEFTEWIGARLLEQMESVA